MKNEECLITNNNILLAKAVGQDSLNTNPDTGPDIAFQVNPDPDSDPGF